MMDNVGAFLLGALAAALIGLICWGTSTECYEAGVRQAQADFMDNPEAFFDKASKAHPQKYVDLMTQHVRTGVKVGP